MRRIVKKILFLLLLFPHLLLAQTSEFKLSNGLKIIVREDHRSPVVVSQVWYRAGSLDEVNGKTGVAHVLEHMMFKGTKKLKLENFQGLLHKRAEKKMLLRAQTTLVISSNLKNQILSFHLN